MLSRRSRLYRRRRVMLAVLIVLWLLAFTATHIPGTKLSGLPASATVLHMSGYFVLALVFCLTMIAYGTSRLHRLAVIIPVVIFYAAMDELTQPYFHRSAQFPDWLADIAGAGIAILLCEVIFAIATRRKRTPAK